MDVDKGGALAVTAVKALLGDPLVEVPSQTKEHFHLWYKSESKRKARYQWEIEGKGSGEVLYSTRSAILHNPNALVSGLDGYIEAPAVDVSQLPKPKKGSKAEGRNSQLYREFSEATRSADQQAALDRAMSAGLSPDEVERTAKSAEDAARTPQSFFLAEPDPGSGIYFDSDHNGLAAALETASLELARDARTETILIRHTTHDGHASDGFYSMIVGGRPPDKKIEDRPPDGWLLLDTFVDARLRTFIADSFFNINGKRLKCWQPAKVAHFETREIMGWMEVWRAP